MGLKARFLVPLKIIFILLISTTAWSALRPSDPVILIHGWNGNPSVWDDFLDLATTQYGWTFGGQLVFRNNQAQNLFGDRYSLPYAASADVYTVRFDDSFNKPYFQTGNELRYVIDYILQLTRKSKVILVGHSMGGLTARFVASGYVRLSGAKVSQVITVGTPNLGTDLTDLAVRFGIDSTAIRAMRPDSLDLAVLNNDLPNEYWSQPIAYKSIVVRNDEIVSPSSQNLGNVHITIPQHHEIPIEWVSSICTIYEAIRTVHACETRDPEVQNVILNEIFNQPAVILFGLTAQTLSMNNHYERFEAGFIIKSNKNIAGDFYMGIVEPNGEILFIQSLESPSLGHNPQVLAGQINQGENYLFRFDRRDERWPRGMQNFYAIVAMPNAYVLTGPYASGLAGPFGIEF